MRNKQNYMYMHCSALAIRDVNTSVGSAFTIKINKETIIFKNILRQAHLHKHAINKQGPQSGLALWVRLGVATKTQQMLTHHFFPSGPEIPVSHGNAVGWSETSLRERNSETRKEWKTIAKQ